MLHLALESIPLDLAVQQKVDRRLAQGIPELFLPDALTYLTPNQTPYFGATLVLGNPFNTDVIAKIKKIDTAIKDVIGDQYIDFPLQTLHTTIAVLVRGETLERDFRRSWKALEERVGGNVTKWVQSAFQAQCDGRICLSFDSVFLADDGSGNVVIKMNGSDAMQDLKSEITSHVTNAKYEANNFGFMTIGKVAGSKGIPLETVSRLQDVLHTFSIEEEFETSVNEVSLLRTRQRNLLFLESSERIRAGDKL